ncbi:MAG TPA: hypothetical protein H9748_03530 [Candidatus Mediterraneibacter norwichensis]|nr:hypothetical protein [Candidatus Mediterraneibacter norwichensis]
MMKTILPENKELYYVKDKKKENRTRRRAGRVLGWILLAAAVLFIVPVGCIMFMISGVWSAADRVLGRIGK